MCPKLSILRCNHGSAAYAARNENSVLVGSEPHKRLRRAQRACEERPPSRRRRYGVPRRSFSGGGSGAQGSPRATSRPASATEGRDVPDTSTKARSVSTFGTGEVYSGREARAREFGIRNLEFGIWNLEFLSLNLSIPNSKFRIPNSKFLPRVHAL